MQLSNRMSYRLSYSCLIVVLWLPYIRFMLVQLAEVYRLSMLLSDLSLITQEWGTLNILFVWRSGLNTQTQEVAPQCVCMFSYACVSECMYVVLPNLICYTPQHLPILELRPTRRPSGNRAPAPQNFNVEARNGQREKQNTHTRRASSLKLGVQGRETHTSSGLKI